MPRAMLPQGTSLTAPARAHENAPAGCQTQPGQRFNTHDDSITKPCFGKASLRFDAHRRWVARSRMGHLPGAREETALRMEGAAAGRREGRPATKGNRAGCGSGLEIR